MASSVPVSLDDLKWFIGGILALAAFVIAILRALLTTSINRIIENSTKVLEKELEALGKRMDKVEKLPERIGELTNELAATVRELAITNRTLEERVPANLRETLVKLEERISYNVTQSLSSLKAVSDSNVAAEMATIKEMIWKLPEQFSLKAKASFEKSAGAASGD